ncbi:hypothetical protein [Candidatus Protochlamydia phocaeensis]|uniref:hypothetical protein n=1 Tax=Candidatus Protochlamydia phocaeensis TaxID=1414722 RepID=UPI000838BAC1|nr:hypothetical protein [Candidatus Protochlamydia phocaeensis]
MIADSVYNNSLAPEWVNYSEVKAKRIGIKLTDEHVNQLFIRIYPARSGQEYATSLLPQMFSSIGFEAVVLKFMGFKGGQMVFTPRACPYEYHLNAESWNDGNWMPSSKIPEIFKNSQQEELFKEFK